MSKETTEVKETPAAEAETPAVETPATETPAAPAAPAAPVIDRTKWKHVSPEAATAETPKWMIMSKVKKASFKFGEKEREIKTGAPKPFDSAEEFKAYVEHVQGLEEFILISGYEQDPIDETSIVINADGSVTYKTRGVDGNPVTTVNAPVARLHIRPFVHETPWAMIPYEKRFWFKTPRVPAAPKPKAEGKTRTRKASSDAPAGAAVSAAPASAFNWDGNHVGSALEGALVVKLERNDEGKILGYASYNGGSDVTLSLESETRPEAHAEVEELLESGKLGELLEIPAAPASDPIE